ncbi:MAG: complement resistance protein TraT [Magnetovibrio sp.]|nr:complement resistance protein TraT [Magnetovibrio sp.]
MRNQWVAIVVIALGLSACIGPNQSRMGMVVDEDSGLLFGSTVQKNIVTDATFYANRKLKVRTRNTSGDTAFGLNNFTQQLNTTYAGKGYEPTTADDFGLLVDVNVVYSGQVQTNSAQTYSWLGAAYGSTYGGDTHKGRLTATVAGAMLGDIIGRYNTDDTYMVVARVTFGVVKPIKESRKRVTFSRSDKLKNIDDPNEDEKVVRGGFKKTYSTEIAIYAGGRNLKQSAIAEEVRKRAARIVADII